MNIIYLNYTLKSNVKLLFDLKCLDDFNQTNRIPDSLTISGSAELETDRNSAKPFDLKIIGRWKSKSSMNALGYFKRLGVGFLAPIVARIKSDQQIKLTQL